MKTLTTDFTAYELKNLNINILVDAKLRCSQKIQFHQSEINTGHSSQYHIDQLEIYFKDFQKWVLIVSDARDRDVKNEADFFGE